MELSGSSIEKVIIFSYILGNENPPKIFRENETLKIFLYFGKWNFYAQTQNMKKKITPKKFLIFQEMELSDSKIKKFLIFSQ